MSDLISSYLSSPLAPKPGSGSKPAPSGGGIDPGLAAALQAAMGAAQPGAAQQKQSYTVNDLVGLLMGTARQTTSSHSFTGKMPSWVSNNPALRSAIRQGVIDPYVGTGDPGQFRVYMGGEKHAVTQSKTVRLSQGAATIDGQESHLTKRNVTKTVKGDKVLTMEQAANEPYLWNEHQVADAIQKFQAAGVTSVRDFDSLTKAWGGLVDRAGKIYSLSSGERKVTPWDVLDLYKNEMAKSGVKLGPGDPGFNGTTQQVSRSVSDVNEGEAWSAIRGTVSEMLGRDPSDQEVRDFTYRMSHLAARNPSISKTITQYKDGQAVSSSTHTKQGFSAADMEQSAYQQAQHNPDYAEYQAATTYFNAALSALGAIGGN